MSSGKEKFHGSTDADRINLELDVAKAKPMAVNAGAEWPVSRREFIKGVGVTVGGSVVVPAVAQRKGDAVALVPSANPIPLTLTINGEKKEFHVDPRTSLLDLLREDMGLTGTKKGCDHGQCGACTVLAGERRINSCLALALSYDGEEITTIEGLAQGEQLHFVQQAFLDNDGLQCGYCTPGQIISAVGLLSEAKKGAPSVVTHDLSREGPIELTETEIKERMSGNICRCGAYPGIVAAVRMASRTGQLKAASPSSEGRQTDAAL